MSELILIVTVVVAVFFFVRPAVARSLGNVGGGE